MDITPLRVSRDFRSLFIAHSVSFVGDEIIAVVVPYQVFKITGSTFAVGMLGLVTLVPVFVFPIIGGAAADAMERRGLIVTTYAILAALSLAMAWNAARPTPLLGLCTCSPSSRPGCTPSTGRRSTRGPRGCSSRTCCRPPTHWRRGSGRPP
jgi:MFS family permease